MKELIGHFKCLDKLTDITVLYWIQQQYMNSLIEKFQFQNVHIEN